MFHNSRLVREVSVTADSAYRTLIAQLLGVHFRDKMSVQHYLSSKLTFLGTPLVPHKRSSQVNLTQLLNYPKMSLAHPSLSIFKKKKKKMKASLLRKTIQWGDMGRRLAPKMLKHNLLK